MLQNFICLHLYFAWEHPIPMNAASLSLPTFVHAYYAFDSNPHLVMVDHYESNKFYDAFHAFDPFDSNAHLVVAEHYESNKFYDAFDAFDSNAHLVVAEHYESNKFYDAFYAFDSNAHLVMAEHYESNKFYDAFDAFDFNPDLRGNIANCPSAFSIKTIRLEVIHYANSEYEQEKSP